MNGHNGLTLLVFIFLILLVQTVSADVVTIDVTRASYLELLVKTSDNSMILNRTTATTAELAEERRGNAKQGYIVTAHSEGWIWGTLERDPKRFAIVKIPASEWNNSWLEPEYNYSAFTDDYYLKLRDCYEYVNGTMDFIYDERLPWCNKSYANYSQCVKDSYKECDKMIEPEYEMLTKRKYRLPLENFLTSLELTALSSIKYNEKVNWTINKTVANISTRIEAVNWSARPADMKLHGSSGTFTICVTNATGECDYSSLYNWEQAEDGDIRAGGDCIANITEGFEEYRTDTIIIDGWTTNASAYVRITVWEPARHKGVWNTSAYRFVTNTTSPNFEIYEDFAEIDGVQIRNNKSESGSTTVFGYRYQTTGAGNTHLDFHNMILRGSMQTSYGLLSSGNYGQHVDIWNNIIYDHKGTTAYCARANGNPSNVTIYSNTMYNCTIGVRNDNNNGTVLINNIVSNTSSSSYYAATFNVSSGWNVGDDTNSPGGTNDITSYSPNFVDAPNDDFHLLASDMVIRGNGKNLTNDAWAPFSDDIDYQTRGPYWDRGADQVNDGKCWNFGGFSGYSFDTNIVGNNLIYGITQNNTYFWLTDSTDDEVYQYYINGTYTGWSFDTGIVDNNQSKGITQNGTYFWISDDTNDEVYQYYINGTYTGWSFDTADAGNANVGDITQNNTYFWITDFFDDLVYIYFINGTYTGISFDTASIGNDNPYGITQNGTHIWITDGTDLLVYQYLINGSYTGNNFKVFNSNTGLRGITQNNTYFWISDDTNDEVYQYYMSPCEITPPTPPGPVYNASVTDFMTYGELIKYLNISLVTAIYNASVTDSLTYSEALKIIGKHFALLKDSMTYGEASVINRTYYQDIISALVKDSMTYGEAITSNQTFYVDINNVYLADLMTYGDMIRTLYQAGPANIYNINVTDSLTYYEAILTNRTYYQDISTIKVTDSMAYAEAILTNQTFYQDLYNIYVTSNMSYGERANWSTIIGAVQYYKYITDSMTYGEASRKTLYAVVDIQDSMTYGEFMTPVKKLSVRMIDSMTYYEYVLRSKPTYIRVTSNMTWGDFAKGNYTGYYVPPAKLNFPKLCLILNKKEGYVLCWDELFG